MPPPYGSDHNVSERSASNRNARHNECFRRDPTPDYYADQMSEQPNQELTVEIRLSRPALALDALRIELWNSYNMELTRSPSRTDIVVISGILSSHGTTKDQILQVVQGYDPKAKLLSSRLS